jgi:radical SAM superfamily enzyme YgiQ (UPF0313 family)
MLSIGLIFPNRSRKDKTVHLGLGYLASYARSQHSDLSIKILDTRVATKKEVRSFFEQKWDLFGITVLSPVYQEVIDLVKMLKNDFPGVPVCLGGPYVTTLMEEIFEETPADFAVYGEGEITFSLLISALKGEGSIEKTEGLMYQKNGMVITNPPREQIKNLEALPMPAYDLFPMDRYPMHRIATSRGCPFKCVFCNSSSIWLGKWRKRPVDDIITEIEYLLSHYKKKIFFFNDNSFNVDLNRVEDFCQALINRKIKIMWTTPVRPELITKPLAELMKKAGCYNVGIGVESANNRILQNINKQNTIENIQRGIRIFKEAGIEVLGQFVIGSPGDTIETVKQSLAFAKDSGLDFVMFYAVVPFKGTNQWDYVQHHGTFFEYKIHRFHNIHPRIVFDTPEFTYQERLEVIDLAKEAGFYSETNNQSRFFDFGKELARISHRFLPDPIFKPAYFFMKKLYRKHISV